uniref:Uncharacterized protein n=1 Tax=Rhizophora mucronata TaxID=61149 RepID=A0A2P2PUR5_RHIMU
MLFRYLNTYKLKSSELKKFNCKLFNKLKVTRCFNAKFDNYG